MLLELMSFDDFNYYVYLERIQSNFGAKLPHKLNGFAFKSVCFKKKNSLVRKCLLFSFHIFWKK